ncbi:MAG TPA: Uma2 family endonuclease [Desulfosporosinus sp.]|nr:Uma2 family endonuclease [Desulfosporosinus sp.]
MSEPALSKTEYYNYTDYLSWVNGKRCELIDGIPIDITPASSRIHQKVLGDLYNQFYYFLKDKPCEVYIAPFDVRLPSSEEKDETASTVVQPDLVVVCDPTKLDDRGCKGTPDLVIEVLSPETAKKDLSVKLRLYERAGVSQYWVVHPVDKTVTVFLLDEREQYSKPSVFGEGEQMRVEQLNGLIIDFSTVFK